MGYSMAPQATMSPAAGVGELSHLQVIVKLLI